MTQTTTGVHRATTLPSPSAAFHDRASSMLRRLASTEPDRGLFLSAYLDLEPPRDQADAGSRAMNIVLRDRLAEIAATLPAHGPVRESFERDAQRLRDIATEG